MNKIKLFFKWLFLSIVFIIKIIIILSSFFITYSFSVQENNAGAIIFASFTLFFILFFFGSNFEIVELLGVKFKLHEIKKSVDELKLVTKLSVAGLLNIGKHLGCFASSEMEITQNDIYEESVKILKILDVPDIEIYEITEKWHKRNEETYFHEIYKQLEHRLVKEKSEDISKLRELKNEIKELNPHNIQMLLDITTHKSDEDLLLYIEDYKYYIKFKKHKDFNRWIKLNTFE